MILNILFTSVGLLIILIVIGIINWIRKDEYFDGVYIKIIIYLYMFICALIGLIFLSVGLNIV